MNEIEVVELERLTSPTDGHLMIRMEIRALDGGLIAIATKDRPQEYEPFRFTVRVPR